MIFMFEFFVFIDYWLIYRQPATSYSIRWFKETVILFQDKCRQARLSQSERKRILKQTTDKWEEALLEQFHRIFPLVGRWLGRLCSRPISRLCARGEIFLTLANFNRQTLFGQSFTVQPNLSISLRRLLLLSLQAIEWITLSGQIITLLTASQLVLVIYLRVGDGFTWTALPLAALDLLSFYHQLYQLLNLAFFFTFCTLISVLVNMKHCRAICRQLTVALSKKKRHSRRWSSSRFFARAFSLFLADYYRCIGLATYGNGQLFSLVLFAFLLTNVPVNIYFLMQIVFNSKNTPMLIASMVVCVFQGVALYAVLGPLAFFCSAMHRPTKIFPVVQLQLGTEPGALQLKLKLDNLLFRLLRHPAVTISVGPLSPVTHSFILEFIFMYAGYLQMAFSMKMQNMGKGGLD